jgi:uncharacterized protein (DUF608 family)
MQKILQNHNKNWEKKVFRYQSKYAKKEEILKDWTPDTLLNNLKTLTAEVKTAMREMFSLKFRVRAPTQPSNHISLKIYKIFLFP